MAKVAAADKFAGVGNDAVKAKTGKSWAQWFKLLDSAGAAKMPHKEIAKLLHAKHGCSSWWSQMITVAYEQARGLRVRLQTHAGDFSGSASKTIATSVARAFAAWMDDAVRVQWLPKAKFEVTQVTPNRSIRMTDARHGARIEVMFYAKGAAKCQITVQHSKLKSAKEAIAKKTLWSTALDRLKKLLET